MNHTFPSLGIPQRVNSSGCWYYSNLIEGHDTHPIDIERALKNDYSSSPEKRDLQMEAKAHMGVQSWIDGGGLTGRATTTDGLLEIHRRFYQAVPEDLKWSGNSETRAAVIPGTLRERDVEVGRHVPVSPGALPRFLTRFEAAYSSLGPAATVLAAAAAHHRLVWIHPFLDGNGRVARLMSHAMLLEPLETAGLWSIARGLARNAAVYKEHLGNCDLPRRNDLDGRGSRSEEALNAFTTFFLKSCLDQVSFMESLMEPSGLRARILLWSEEAIKLGQIPARCQSIFEALLYRGDLPKGEVCNLLNITERQASRVISTLLKTGALTTSGPRAPLTLAFPAALAARWMPGLFPEHPH